MIRSILMATPMLLCAGFASAQTGPAMPGPGGGDMIHMMVVGAHNQLGVIEFCQAKGYLGADAVALQQRMLTMLPQTSDDGMAEAEALGKTGTVSMAGTSMTLDDAAKRQNTTVQALCAKIGETLAQAAAQLPK